MWSIFRVLLLLWVAVACGQPAMAADVTKTFAWDWAAQDDCSGNPITPTFELEANGVSQSGISGTSATLTVPVGTDNTINARVRAIPPGGTTFCAVCGDCGTDPPPLPPSDWTSAQIVLAAATQPLVPSNVQVTKTLVEVPPVAVSVLQTVAGTDVNYTSGSTAVVTLSGVTAGSSIHGMVAMDHNADVSSITSSPSLTWSVIANSDSTATTQRAVTFYANGAASGSLTITVTLTASVNFRGIVASEIGGTSGYDSSVYAAQIQAAPGTATDAVTSGNTPTLSTQPALVSAFSIRTDDCTAPNTGTGFTSSGAYIDWGGLCSPVIRQESKRVTSTAATAGTFTATASGAHYITHAAVFKETSSTITGSGAPAAQAATVAGSGTVTPPSVTGSGAPAAQAATASGAGTVTVTGSGAPAAQAATASGAGTVTAQQVTGSGAPAAQAATASGAGTVTVTGSGAPAAQVATASGAGTVTVTGSGAPAAQAATASGSGTVTAQQVTGSGAPAAQAATASGTGTVTGGAITSSGAPAAQAATASGAGTVTVTGSGTPAAQAATASGSGAVTVTGSGAPAAQVATASGAGTVTVTGSGTPAAQEATVSGAGTVTGGAITSSGAPVAQAATVSGIGTVTNLEAPLTSSGGFGRWVIKPREKHKTVEQIVEEAIAEVYKEVRTAPAITKEVAQIVKPFVRPEKQTEDVAPAATYVKWSKLKQDVEATRRLIVVLSQELQERQDEEDLLLLI